jgi:3-dehydroquinate synthase
LSKPQSLSVDLGDRSYPIIIGNGLLATFDLESGISGGDVLVVSNETVGPLYLDKVKERLGNKSVRSIELPDGEQFKTLATAQLVIDELVSMGANRDATLIALGGGVVGDITGFAAACYMRGVSFIQIPTTLLSQVDSSVGGKTGVNHEGGKNLIGAFHQPKLVLIDTDTLSTLPDRELSAGMAEVIKHGAIADIEYFAWLEENVGNILAREPDVLAHTIRRSCEIKAQVVSEDEHERGKRALLNFGHTFGHAIENSMGYGEWLHGEAVSAGMLMAAMLGNLPEEQWARLKALLHAANLPDKAPAVGSHNLRAAMALDKKVANKSLRFVLLRSLGEAYITTDYSEHSLNDILAAADG